MQSIKIITPFYNPGEFLDNCVSSIITQKYDNYKVIFTDDCSTDNSWSKLPHDSSKAICIKTDKRKTALENIHNSIINHCDEDDIVVLLDGDDWFPNKNTLSYINEFYTKHNCWIMYGQSQWTDGRRGFACPYTEDEFNNIRNTPFKVSHIRTFKAGLYKKIADQDPNFSCLKDDFGEFYKMTYDVAIMFPILEMAGHEKTKFNDTILYIYNRNNPISDDKVDQTLQTNIHIEINKKPKFKKIDSL